MTETTLTKRPDDMPVAAEKTEQTPVYLPNVDIRESETEVVLLADMPGVDETKVSIDLEGTQLAIRGQFLPRPPEGYSLTYREYGSGNYERTFTLGETIDREGIKATVKDGVLRLVLPKAKESQPKRIVVKAG